MTFSHRLLFSLSVIAGLAASSVARAQVTASETVPDEWISENYASVMRSVLAPTDVGASPFPRDVRWYVSVQIRSTRRPEEVLTLWKTEREGLRLEIKRPMGGNLEDVLKRAYPEMRTETPELIASKLPMTTTTVTADTCRELDALASQFEGLRVALRPMIGFAPHGTGYRFIVKDWTGYQLSGMVIGNEALLTDQKEPLAAWAERTRQVAQRCTGERPQP